MEGMTIDLAQHLPLILEIMGGVVLALGAWAIKRFATKMGLESDEKIRGYLMEALKAGVTYGKNKAMEELSDADWTKIEVKNAMLAHAASYVMTRVPDAVKKFNLTEQDVKDLVLARLEN